MNTKIIPHIFQIWNDQEFNLEKMFYQFRTVKHHVGIIMFFRNTKWLLLSVYQEHNLSIAEKKLTQKCDNTLTRKQSSMESCVKSVINSAFMTPALFTKTVTFPNSFKTLVDSSSIAFLCLSIQRDYLNWLFLEDNSYLKSHT